MSRRAGDPANLSGLSAPRGSTVANCRGLLTEYDLPGLAALPVNWTGDGVVHSGVTISASDRRGYRPVLTGVAILCALKRSHPDKLEFLGRGRTEGVISISWPARRACAKASSPGGRPGISPPNGKRQVARFSRRYAAVI